jgi:hypothetical protein
LVAGAATLVLVGLWACGSRTASPGAASAPASTLPAQLTGLPIGQARLAADQLTVATNEAATFAGQLVAAHPELQGISVPTITAVYDEHSPAPIGAMARWTWPAAIPDIQLDLVRLHHSGPETMPSRVTNLRALEMIYLFDKAQVVYVGIAPGPDDAADPAGVAVVHPLHPDQTRSTDFEGVE